MTHPEWCDLKRCGVDQLGGVHRGMARTVLDSRQRPAASAWWQQKPGGPLHVGFAASGVFDPEVAERIAALLGEVAGAAGLVGALDGPTSRLADRR